MRWAVLLLCGCGSSASGKLALSWSFADGRACPDTGAAAISIRVDNRDPEKHRCDEGILPAAVTLGPISADGANLHVEALSTESAALYSGTLNLDALPSAATITLYAEKMR